MKIIGITGGVGAGKSTILNYMRDVHGAVICEADKVAHELEKPGENCYEQIITHFGEEILSENGEIDRKKLSNIVFREKEKLTLLNCIIHPQVKEYIKKKIKTEKEKKTALFVVEAALLIEDHYDEICDELWYIHASDEVRKRRLKASRGYSDEKIDGIMRNQKSEEEFRKHCRVVIENSGEVKDTCRQVEKALES